MNNSSTAVLSQHKKLRGFSLLEIMIAVAIVGILTSIALPSYRNYVARAELQSAFYELEKYKFYVGKYLQDNGDFSGIMDEYGRGWKRLGPVSKMFEMDPKSLNVTGYNESSGAATGIVWSKQYHIKRGYAIDKNRFYMYVYFNRHKVDKSGNAPYLISYWVKKQPNGQFTYECHSYNGYKGGWDKVGQQYLPVKCRR